MLLPKLSAMPSTVRIRNPFTQIIFLRNIKIIQIYAVQQAFFLNLPQYLRLHLSRVNSIVTQQ